MGLAYAHVGGICFGQPRRVIKEGTTELLVKLTQKSDEGGAGYIEDGRVFSFPSFHT